MPPEAEANSDMEGALDRHGGSWEDRSSNTPQNAPGPDPKGLAPSDLTSLPEESRELINWLARRKMATFEDMENALDKDSGSIVKTLGEVQAKGYIKEMTIRGVIFYRVAFQGRPRRVSQGLGKDFWDRIDLKDGKPQEE